MNSGFTPPIAWPVSVTADPDWATGRAIGGNVRPALIVQVKEVGTGDEVPSVTETVTLLVPAVDGVPLMSPVVLLSESPAGSPVAV
jgi:hypothetical protein